MDKITIKQLEDFVFEHKFNTRGLPFQKKMWRDGYNKALQDFLNYIYMQIQTDHTGRS